MTKVEDGRYSYASSYPEAYEAFFVEFIDGPYAVPVDLYEFDYAEITEPDVEVSRYKTRVPPAMQEFQLLVLRRPSYDGAVTILGSDDLGFLLACT
jgi:hypothetical protein